MIHDPRSFVSKEKGNERVDENEMEKKNGTPYLNVSTGIIIPKNV